MCGIIGFSKDDKDLIKKLTSTLKHRGPDNIGFYVDDEVSFGHTRLSIIDLSPKGSQPMIYDYNNSKYIISFNGEIYNYQKLRADLKERGYKFDSNSDTEVLLASYIEYGEKCVLKFNGMWAFAIFDESRKKIFCSRDISGQKPLYYGIINDIFFFSSELKPFMISNVIIPNKKSDFDQNAIELYINLGFIPAPFSIFSRIRKLQCGENLNFDTREKKISNIYKYYKLPHYNPIDNKKYLLKNGTDILFDAVKLRTIADVPVGSFLSGGLDSTTIVGVLANYIDTNDLHTFSVGFEGNLDETRYIKIAEEYYNTNHHHIYFYENEFENLFNEYSYVYDEPFADWSGFAVYKVSQLAKKWVKVVLSGDGGDEIFGGYKHYNIASCYSLIKSMPSPIIMVGSKFLRNKGKSDRSLIYRLGEAFYLSKLPYERFFSESYQKYRINSNFWKKWSRNKLHQSMSIASNNFVEGIRIFDLRYKTIPDQYLTKVDRASMANGLEVRCPFLDYRFLEFSQKIPTKWKNTIFKNKILMRDLIKPFVPKPIVKRGKKGFTPPMKSWMLRKWSDNVIKDFGFLKKISKSLFTKVKSTRLKKNNQNHMNYMIRLLILKNWYQRWIEN